MKFASLRRLWRDMKTDPDTAGKLSLLKPIIYRAMLWLLVNELCVLLEVYPVKLMVDSLNTKQHLFGLSHAANIILVLVATGVIFSLSSLTWRFMDRARNSASWLFFVALNSHGTRQQMALDAGWHTANGTAAKESKLAKNHKKVDYMLDELQFSVVPQAVRIALIGASIFLINWQYGLVACATIAGCLTLMARSERLVAPLRREYRSFTRMIERSDTELAATALTSKEQGIDDQLAAAHDALLMEHWRREVPRHGRFLKVTWLQAQPIIMSRVAFFAVTFLCFGHGMGMGTFVMASAWLERIWSNLWRFSEFQHVVNEGGQALEEIVELFETEPAIQQPANPVWPTRPAGSLVLDHVTFTYPGAAEPALRDVHLRIESGTTVAFVGPSGGGKSTLAKLIGRSYDPQSGRILVGGVNLTEIDDRRYRRKLLALVSQEPGLYDRTIAANIGVVRPDATREQIEEAARLADAHDFIMGLPNGYDSLVGERGVMLSGGQRQRLAIARAMLKNARILVLDEPTSALDAESQLSIKETLERLTANRDRTIVLIAHRFSTIAMADLVVVLEDGRVSECGSHDELLLNGRTYSRLHELEGMSV